MQFALSRLFNCIQCHFACMSENSWRSNKMDEKDSGLFFFILGSVNFGDSTSSHLLFSRTSRRRLRAFLHCQEALNRMWFVLVTCDRGGGFLRFPNWQYLKNTPFLPLVQLHHIFSPNIDQQKSTRLHIFFFSSRSILLWWSGLVRPPPRRRHLFHFSHRFEISILPVVEYSYASYSSFKTQPIVHNDLCAWSIDIPAILRASFCINSQPMKGLLLNHLNLCLSSTNCGPLDIEKKNVQITSD